MEFIYIFFLELLNKYIVSQIQFQIWKERQIIKNSFLNVNRNLMSPTVFPFHKSHSRLGPILLSRLWPWIPDLDDHEYKYVYVADSLGRWQLSMGSKSSANILLVCGHSVISFIFSRIGSYPLVSNGRKESLSLDLWSKLQWPDSNGYCFLLVFLPFSDLLFPSLLFSFLGSLIQGKEESEEEDIHCNVVFF